MHRMTQNKFRTLLRLSCFKSLLSFGVVPTWPTATLPNHLERLTIRDPQSSSSPQHSPDEDALVVVALPEAAVALVGHGEDVRCDLSHVVLAVSLHSRAVVQPRDALVGVHRGNYRTNVGLQAHSTPRAVSTPGLEQTNTSQMTDRKYAFAKL